LAGGDPRDGAAIIGPTAVRVTVNAASARNVDRARQAPPNPALDARIDVWNARNRHVSARSGLPSVISCASCKGDAHG